MLHTTREGKELQIKDMTTQHILNTLKCHGGNSSRIYLAELLIRTNQYPTITCLLEEIRDDEFKDDYDNLSYGETF